MNVVNIVGYPAGKVKITISYRGVDYDLQTLNLEAVSLDYIMLESETVEFDTMTYNTATD